MRSFGWIFVGLALGLLAGARPAAAQCDDGCAELVDHATGEVIGYACMAGGERKNCVARRTSCLDEPCESALLRDASGDVLAVMNRCGTTEKLGVVALRPPPAKKAVAARHPPKHEWARVHDHGAGKRTVES